MISRDVIFVARSYFRQCDELHFSKPFVESPIRLTVAAERLISRYEEAIDLDVNACNA